MNRVERIFDSGYRAVLVTTGGGSGALHALLTTPGASRFIADAQIPYSPEALEHYLGEKPEQAVSPRVAIDLARAAVKKVGQVSCLSAVGVSCTAALKTDRARRGTDRAFICIKTEQFEKLYSLYFSDVSREKQEALLSDWILVLIAQAVGAERGLMLSGSFNPLHAGHRKLLQVAEEISGLRGAFELSSANVDKPNLQEGEVLRRASAIKDIPVALTQAPRFIQKAALFPKTTFVLGYDTAVRLMDTAQDDEWEKFRGLEALFLVGGRQPPCGNAFKELDDLTLPKGFNSLFAAIPESIFREDISSTELRPL